MISVQIMCLKVCNSTNLEWIGPHHRILNQNKYLQRYQVCEGTLQQEHIEFASETVKLFQNFIKPFNKIRNATGSTGLRDVPNLVPHGPHISSSSGAMIQ